jgi:hypothetical protein
MRDLYGNVDFGKLSWFDWNFFAMKVLGREEGSPESHGEVERKARDGHVTPI